VLRRLWRRRGRLDPPPELERRLGGDPPLRQRHLAVLAHVATEGERTVGEIARELGLSLPAASKLTMDLSRHALVYRREHVDDRRRTVVDLNAMSSADVRAWAKRRNRPFERALESLDASERKAFLKGLGALADALMEESPCGSERPHHRATHRRGPDRHRPV
jgi:DNA-binding MarR family transcriptional regulator